MRLTLVLAILALTSLSSWAEIQLAPYSAKYTATYDAGWFPISVDARRTLEQVENGQWKISFEAYSSIADFSEVSFFAFDKHIIPQNYQYKTTGFFSKKYRAKTFDWENQTVLLDNKTPADYALSQNMLDSISYQEQMRLDLMQGKKAMAYEVAYKSRIKEFEFEVEGTDTFKSNQGQIEAVKVRQTNHKNKKERTYIWFAKDYDFIILKLVLVDRHGDKNTIVLKRAQIGEQNIELK